MSLFLYRRVDWRSFHGKGAHSEVDRVLCMKEQSEAHTSGFVVTFIYSSSTYSYFVTRNAWPILPGTLQDSS